MAQFNLEKDWPIVAAGAAAIVGVVALSRRGTQPVVVGGGTPAGYEEAIAGQVAIAQGQQAVQQTLIAEFGQTERVKLETEAAVQAMRIKAAGEQAAAQQNLLGTIVTGLFGLFSWETTARGEEYRRFSGGRMRLAYGVR